MEGATLIIGIGNRFRGDDALGPLVADELRRRFASLPLNSPLGAGGENVDLIEHTGEPAGLMEAWQGYGKTILIDAVFSGAAPGAIHHFDLTKEKLPADFAKPTTHAVGIAEAVEFARVLKKLTPQIEFYGVEGARYDAGESLTPSVQKALEEVVERIIGVVKRKG